MTRLEIRFAAQFYAHKGSKLLPKRPTVLGAVSRVFALFLISLFLITRGFSADRIVASHSTINGKWKFNVRNSNMANMPVPQQATLSISVRGNKLTWRETGLDGNGTRFDETFNGPIDGTPHLLKGRFSHVTISFKQKNGAIVGTWKGKGKRLSIARVSPGGRSLTVENASNVYNMVSNWTTSWDRAPE